MFLALLVIGELDVGPARDRVSPQQARRCWRALGRTRVGCARRAATTVCP